MRGVNIWRTWEAVVEAKGGSVGERTLAVRPTTSTFGADALEQSGGIGEMRRKLRDAAFAYADCRASLGIGTPKSPRAMSRADREELDAAVGDFAQQAAAAIKRLGRGADDVVRSGGAGAASEQEANHQRRVAKRLSDQLKLLVECADEMRNRRARMQKLVAMRLGPMDGFALYELPSPAEVAAQLSQRREKESGSAEKVDDERVETAEAVEAGEAEEAEGRAKSAGGDGGGGAATKKAVRPTLLSKRGSAANHSAAALPEATRRALERENVLILEAREGELLQVEAIEQSMHEITDMLSFFSERVEAQHEDVVFAEQAVEEAREDVEKGNRHLDSALKTGGNRVFFATFYSTMCFAVLFLHWMSD